MDEAERIANGAMRRRGAVGADPSEGAVKVGATVLDRDDHGLVVSGGGAVGVGNGVSAWVGPNRHWIAKRLPFVGGHLCAFGGYDSEAGNGLAE